MTWIAVRTKPGAQLPQREYAAETTRSKKGYRIVPSLNPNLSAIERALNDAGFTHYMPAEKRLIRDRRKPDVWKTRRFALAVGYVFVSAPVNTLVLEAVPGVDSIVRNHGLPVSIDVAEIVLLRTLEASAEAEFDRKVLNAQRALRRRMQTSAQMKGALKTIIDKLDKAGTVPVGTELVAA